MRGKIVAFAAFGKAGGPVKVGRTRCWARWIVERCSVLVRVVEDRRIGYSVD